MPVAGLVTRAIRYAMKHAMPGRNTKSDQPADTRPRGGRARSVAEMLPAVGGVAFRRFGFVQSAVISRWHEIVGERYARVSTPESIRFPRGARQDGVLTVSVASGHATMLQHVAPTIVERVNRFFGYPAVARITLRQDAMVRRLARVAPPAPAVVPPQLGDSLKPIADPELRAVLEALAQGLANSEGAPAVVGVTGSPL